MDFGSSLHALAPRKLKDHCPVERRHLNQSNSLRFLVVWLWICERFLNFCDRYAGAPSLRHLYIMTQSLNCRLLFNCTISTVTQAKAAKEKTHSVDRFSYFSFLLLLRCFIWPRTCLALDIPGYQSSSDVSRQ